MNYSHNTGQGFQVPSGRDTQSRQGNRKALMVIAVVVAIALGVGGGLAATVFRPAIENMINPAADYDGDGGAPTQITIAEGEYGSAIATKLKDADVVASRTAFLDAVKEHPEGNKIQPGTYELPTQIPAVKAVQMLVNHKESKKQLVVQTIEGMRAVEIYERIGAKLNIPADEVKKVALSGEIGLPASAGGKPEGYLFPATYDFPLDADAKMILTAMTDRFKEEMQRLGVDPAKERELVVKASIVQAEGGKPDVQAKIARVVENRLALPMRLQMDSTVSYQFNERKVTTTDKQRKTSGPYNTYLLDGLPEGPIGNPGAAALKAVQQPASGPWLFFVAVNTLTGETKFSVTKAEHDRYVAEWKAWAKAHEREVREAEKKKQEELQNGSSNNG